VYVVEKDFKNHYPYMLKYGYKTAYECMGLLYDKKVPDNVKWALWT